MAKSLDKFSSFFQARMGRADKAGSAAKRPDPKPLPSAAAAAATRGMEDLFHGANHSRQRILQSTELKNHFDALAVAQRPKYYVIACSDSRVSPPEIFGMRPGSMFEMQQLGALMPALPQGPFAPQGPVDSEWANVSYAVRELKVEHLIVLGHTGCGAVAGVITPNAIAHNVEVAAHLHKHQELLPRVEARFGHLSGDAKWMGAVGESVVLTYQKVKAFAPVQAALKAGALQVHAMVYEIGNHGAISVWDEATDEFVAVNAEQSILPKRHTSA
jgi:carbonic anhydrase